MNQIAKFDAPTMSSREIAELVESRHDKVKQSVERLAARGVIDLPPLGEYLDTLHRPATEYRISKRDSYVIVAQLSPEFTARLVDRWQQLEAQVSAPAISVPQTMSEALRLAADLADERDRLRNDLQVAEPKIRALDRLTLSDGSMCITDAAKAMQIQPKRLFDYMSANQWIYRRPGAGIWTAYQDKLQSHVLEHKIGMVQRDDGSERVTTRVLVTSKGLAELARRLECTA